MWKNTWRSSPARACHTMKPWRTCLEDAIGCLPSVANMWQQSVIDFAKVSENRTTQKSKEGGKRFVDSQHQMPLTPVTRVRTSLGSPKNKGF